MIDSQANQRSFLRRSVGHAEDTSLVSDDLLDDCLFQALREVNQHFAKVGVGSFDTVEDQQQYTPIPSDGYEITKIFYPTNSDCVYPDVFSSAIDNYRLSDAIDEFGTRRVYEPSIVAGFYQGREFFDRMFGNGGYVLNGTQVYLDPVPGSTVTTVYFLFRQERYASVADVEDIHVQPYYAYAQAVLHEALAVGRGGLSSVSSSGGVGMTTKASSHHLAMAEKMRKRFESFLPVLMPGRMWP